MRILNAPGDSSGTCILGSSLKSLLNDGRQSVKKIRSRPREIGLAGSNGPKTGKIVAGSVRGNGGAVNAVTIDGRRDTGHNNAMGKRGDIGMSRVPHIFFRKGFINDGWVPINIGSEGYMG